jgi:hypothetical protein
MFSTIKAQNWCASQAPQAAVRIAETYARPKTEVTIPVVVHVVWHTAAEMISAAQVHSQIAVLNQDFRAANVDLDDVFFFYTPIVADTEINFELVSSDPNGNPHPGIIYRQTEVAGIGSQFDAGRRKLCYDNLGGSDAWPTDCYLNIWVADLGIVGVAGIGIFPDDIGSLVPVEEDGVYLEPERFGTIGTVSEPYHLGRTTTHEIGHYFNLLHPWGRETPPDNCSPAVCCDDPQYDDFVEDTGKQIRTFLGECPTGSSGGCEPSHPHNSQNFMGFADDACALMFTEDQKTRMWETLMTSRASLLEACKTSATYGSLPPDAWLEYAYWQAEQLQLTTLSNGIKWQLYHASGQLVYDIGNLPSGSYVFDLPKVVAGLYILVGTDGRQYRSRKLVKF